MDYSPRALSFAFQSHQDRPSQPDTGAGPRATTSPDTTAKSCSAHRVHATPEGLAAARSIASTSSIDLVAASIHDRMVKDRSPIQIHHPAGLEGMQSTRSTIATIFDKADATTIASSMSCEIDGRRYLPPDEARGDKAMLLDWAAERFAAGATINLAKVSAGSIARSAAHAANAGAKVTLGSKRIQPEQDRIMAELELGGVAGMARKAQLDHVQTPIIERSSLLTALANYSADLPEHQRSPQLRQFDRARAGERGRAAIGDWEPLFAGAAPTAHAHAPATGTLSLVPLTPKPEEYGRALSFGQPGIRMFAFPYPEPQALQDYVHIPDVGRPRRRGLPLPTSLPEPKTITVDHEVVAVGAPSRFLIPYAE